LVPLNNPMTLLNDNASRAKTNAYRAGVDQLPIGGGDNGDGATYCTNLFNNAAGIQRVFKDRTTFQNAPSVDPAMATNLFTFLAMRANQSFVNLGCDKLLPYDDRHAHDNHGDRHHGDGRRDRHDNPVGQRHDHDRWPNHDHDKCSDHHVRVSHHDRANHYHLHDDHQ
jgi:hypothetical protein